MNKLSESLVQGHRQLVETVRSEPQRDYDAIIKQGEAREKQFADFSRKASSPARTLIGAILVPWISSVLKLHTDRDVIQFKHEQIRGMHPHLHLLSVIVSKHSIPIQTPIQDVIVALKSNPESVYAGIELNRAWSKLKGVVHRELFHAISTLKTAEPRVFLDFATKTSLDSLPNETMFRALKLSTKDSLKKDPVTKCLFHNASEVDEAVLSFIREHKLDNIIPCDRVNGNKRVCFFPSEQRGIKPHNQQSQNAGMDVEYEDDDDYIARKHQELHNNVNLLRRFMGSCEEYACMHHAMQVVRHASGLSCWSEADALVENMHRSMEPGMVILDYMPRTNSVTLVQSFMRQNMNRFCEAIQQATYSKPVELLIQQSIEMGQKNMEEIKSGGKYEDLSLKLLTDYSTWYTINREVEVLVQLCRCISSCLKVIESVAYRTSLTLFSKPISENFKLMRKRWSSLLETRQRRLAQLEAVLAKGDMERGIKDTQRRLEQYLINADILDISETRYKMTKDELDRQTQEGHFDVNLLAEVAQQGDKTPIEPSSCQHLAKWKAVVKQCNINCFHKTAQTLTKSALSDLHRLLQEWNEHRVQTRAPVLPQLSETVLMPGVTVNSSQFAEIMKTPAIATIAAFCQSSALPSALSPEASAFQAVSTVSTCSLWQCTHFLRACVVLEVNRTLGDVKPPTSE